MSVQTASIPHVPLCADRALVLHEEQDPLCLTGKLCCNGTQPLHHKSTHILPFDYGKRVLRITRVRLRALSPASCEAFSPPRTSPRATGRTGLRNVCLVAHHPARHSDPFVPLGKDPPPPPRLRSKMANQQSGREIITLQLGNYSNFVGSHFWNLQDQYFVEEGQVCATMLRTRQQNIESLMWNSRAFWCLFGDRFIWNTGCRSLPQQLVSLRRDTERYPNTYTATSNVGPEG